MWLRMSAARMTVRRFATGRPPPIHLPLLLSVIRGIPETFGLGRNTVSESQHSRRIGPLIHGECARQPRKWGSAAAVTVEEGETMLQVSSDDPLCSDGSGVAAGPQGQASQAGHRDRRSHGRGRAGRPAQAAVTELSRARRIPVAGAADGAPRKPGSERRTAGISYLRCIAESRRPEASRDLPFECRSLSKAAAIPNLVSETYESAPQLRFLEQSDGSCSATVPHVHQR